MGGEREERGGEGGEGGEGEEESIACCQESSCVSRGCGERA